MGVLLFVLISKRLGPGSMHAEATLGVIFQNNAGGREIVQAVNDASLSRNHECPSASG
jgi:hypothetical protein